MKYIDMHIHLETYAPDTLDKETLYIHNTMGLNSYNESLKKFNPLTNIITSFGIHPMNVTSTSVSRNQIIELLNDSPFIGEIGLDYHWVEDKRTYPKQLEIFRMMLGICRDLDKIPMIHTKGAEKEVLELLKEFDIKTSLIHWYSGPITLIEEYLKLGAYFTIGPDIYNDTSIFRSIPLNRLFLETDNPTGTPWIVGEERDIRDIYNYFSNLIGIDEKQLQIQLCHNYSEFISKRSKTL